MDNAWDFPADEPAKPVKPKTGRPTGSRNKTVTQKLIIERFDDVYNDIEHMLTAEQKKYYQDAFKGKQRLDPLSEAELFARLFGLYTIAITTKALAEQVARKEVAENANQYRQILNDIEGMTRKREETKAKSNESGNVVDPTRESALARFKTLRGESS